MSTALVSDKFVNINYSTVLIQIANSYTVFIMPVIMHNAGIQLTVQWLCCRMFSAVMQHVHLPKTGLYTVISGDKW